MNEVELKSVVPDDDVERCQQRLRSAGARLVYQGTLEDRRYDDLARSMRARDHVLRLRAYRNGSESRAMLDWKGPTQYDTGYKVRQEISARSTDPDTLAAILEQLGYEVTREIDREITQYELGDTVVRFEHYPRMDTLVEIEGTPDGIEKTIATLGLPREGFTSERLTSFVRRYEERTGQRAALCARELAGDYRYLIEDA